MDTARAVIRIGTTEELADLQAALRAARFVCAERERELLELKGPCRYATCRLHFAHAGPCDVVAQDR